MPRHLTAFEKEELLRWFLHHMSQSQRLDLMTTYPAHYALLYPSVGADAVAAKVEIAIDTKRHQVDVIERVPVL